MAVEITLGSAEKIYKVVAEIKKAVETAKRNREAVVDIRERVETVEDVVSELDETDATMNPSMDRALANLHRSLHRALELVNDCEKKHMMCLLCTARDLSKQLLRVQDDISHKLLLVTLATTVHITKRLGKANRMRRKKSIVRRRRQDCLRRVTQMTSCSAGSLSTMMMDEDEDEVLVPPFGEWDENNSASSAETAEKYTNMFKKVRDNRFDKGETKVETGVEDPSTTLSGALPRPHPHPLPAPPPPRPAGTMAPAMSVMPASGGPPCPVPELEIGLKMFCLPELNAATNNFSADRVIGKGSDSTVYKGVLLDGLVVALKVLLDSHLEDSEARLLDEVKIGAKLKHKNVVKHLGYCMDVGSKLVEHSPLHDGKKVSAQKQTHVLVLDYLPNGSLGDIFKGKKLVELSSCFRIIQEIAQGVHYLHEQRVVHGDLKPDNILFDTRMNPVIIDFGISIILEPDVDEEILDTPVGTLGYMAPEMYEFRRLSMKSDVFAFGVCLVRTVIFLSTGRREWYDAQDWDEMLRKAGGLKGFLDPTIHVDKSQLLEMNRYLEVGWLCTDMDPAKRPTMADVVLMLSGEKELPTPKNRRTKGRRAWSDFVFCTDLAHRA